MSQEVQDKEFIVKKEDSLFSRHNQLLAEFTKLNARFQYLVDRGLEYSEASEALKILQAERYKLNSEKALKFKQVKSVLLSNLDDSQKIKLLSDLNDDLVPLLFKAIKDKFPLVQNSSMKLLINLKELTLKNISDYFEDDFQIVRLTVAKVIDNTTHFDEQTMPILLKALNSKYPDIRKCAIINLPRVETSVEKIIPILIKACTDESKLVRSSAIYCLNKFEERALPYLIVALEDQNYIARATSIKAISKMSCDIKEAIPYIKKALEDKIFLICRTALKALIAKLDKFDDIFPILLKCLEHEDLIVRQNAMINIGRFGLKAKEAVPVLIKFLSEKNLSLRDKAIVTLGNIGHRDELVINQIKKITRINKNKKFKIEVKQILKKLGINKF